MEKHVINFKEVDITVTGSYVEQELGERYDSNLTGAPGSPHEFTVESIYIGRYNITALLDNDFDEIEQQILEEKYN